MEGTKQKECKPHRSIIYACFGCLSNTGATAGLGSIEAVKELGLDRVAGGCLPALPLGVHPAVEKAKTAKKIITVDGCPFECSKKTVEAAGFKPTKSFMLVRDIGMKKTPLDKGDMMDYISSEDVEETKRMLVKAVLEE